MVQHCHCLTETEKCSLGCLYERIWVWGCNMANGRSKVAKGTMSRACHDFCQDRPSADHQSSVNSCTFCAVHSVVSRCWMQMEILGSSHLTHSRLQWASLDGVTSMSPRFVAVFSLLMFVKHAANFAMFIICQSIGPQTLNQAKCWPLDVCNHAAYWHCLNSLSAFSWVWLTS